ncbi:hypothetical protein SAMN02800691_0800 [Luteibacter sp. UNCMF366Tsu5.1]|nr:hypothetical protein SAMN02800691_0800 [Luteibacter sp. UNCMF366Tsu5.1]
MAARPGSDEAWFTSPPWRLLQVDRAKKKTAFAAFFFDTSQLDQR